MEDDVRTAKKKKQRQSAGLMFSGIIVFIGVVTFEPMFFIGAILVYIVNFFTYDIDS
tara:strand:- start:461 stop:631 length:171 start_codon:yes stop_codon:yes gene_type:complete